MAEDQVTFTAKAGSNKTYYFDVKKSKKGNPYLVITESRKKDDNSGYERANLVVFAHHAQEFLDNAKKAIKVMMKGF